ncbi:MAG: LysE family transporter [Bacteroidales bacterium]|nr:LysE family transporter [Bacteroidales bacterium]
MELNLLIRGLIIGLVISIPIGPLGILCIQRTINKGRTSGFLSGMGIATADTIFALIAGLGISFIINFLKEQQLYFQILGGIVIISLGIKIFFANPIKQFRMRRKQKGNLFEDFFSVLLLALSNPITALVFLSLFAGLNLFGDPENHFNAITVIGGIFISTTFWWFILSTIINMFRARFRLRRLFWLNRITGGAIFLIGLLAIFSPFIIKGVNAL